MPLADILIDATTRHKYLTFMDGYAGYYQIKIEEKDRYKTAFDVLDH